MNVRRYLRLFLPVLLAVGLLVGSLGMTGAGATGLNDCYPPDMTAVNTVYGWASTHISFSSVTGFGCDYIRAVTYYVDSSGAVIYGGWSATYSGYRSLSFDTPYGHGAWYGVIVEVKDDSHVMCKVARIFSPTKVEIYYPSNALCRGGPDAYYY